MTGHDRFVDHLAADTLDAEDRGHVARCRACAALLATPATVPGGDGMGGRSAEMLAALHRELGRRRGPSWLPLAAVMLGNALLALGAVVYLEAWNWEVSASPHWLFALTAAALAALATVGVGWGLAPGRRRFRGALLLALVAPVLVLVAADGHVANERFLDGAECLWTVLGSSLLPLGAAAFLLTRFAASPARSLAVGLGGAGVGLLILQFHCADGARSHLVVFHLLPWLLLGGLLVLVRRALPSWSHAP